MQYPHKPLIDQNLRRKGIYLLPNLITTTALFAGFYAIVQAMGGHYDQASAAIFVAMVLDGLDGRVARATHTQSPFGAEFDSLSDMVSFGVAPALVVYVWALQGMGKLGWIGAFIFCVGAALRLARFNTRLDVADKRFFQVWVLDDYGIVGKDVSWLAWGVTIFAGLTMVSNVRYYSFKEINMKKSIPFVALLLIILGFALLTYKPPQVLFLSFIAYALSGYVMWAFSFWKKRNRPPVD
jgi:CDP-diacylglycerol--serine O-phosphatidyltransferase